MRSERMQAFAVVTLLTVYAFLVHGYHPYAEDGGVYVAGIKWLLNPSLYPHQTAFVTEHLRFSLFAPMVAWCVRLTHLSLAWVLLLSYCGCLWATFYGAWMVLARCVESKTARYGGMVLLACWASLPIAGTSLMLVDPYLTARSISTPATLFCVAGILDVQHGRTRTGMALALASLLAAIAIHPLMGGYALGSVLLLACLDAKSPATRVCGVTALCVLALSGACILQATARAESVDYVRVAMTRYYWFPAQWHWYERVGLVAPVAILWALAPGNRTQAWKSVGGMAVVLAGLSIAIAALFARVSLTSHLVARMQPLRCFQIVYLVMILLLGATIGEHVLKARAWRWAAMLCGMGGLMFYVQRTIYPASAHLEMPWHASPNPWVQAFVWAKEHTPGDALFALDANYITRDGEDAQCFRAIAERSALPDYSKDGGEAAITPGLTETWVAGQVAQTNLSAETDETRRANLHPSGVSWVILQHAAVTDFACPYGNDTVKVCQVPR